MKKVGSFKGNHFHSHGLVIGSWEFQRVMVKLQMLGPLLNRWSVLKNGGSRGFGYVGLCLSGRYPAFVAIEGLTGITINLAQRSALLTCCSPRRLYL